MISYASKAMSAKLRNYLSQLGSRGEGGSGESTNEGGSDVGNEGNVGDEDNFNIESDTGRGDTGRGTRLHHRSALQDQTQYVRAS